MFPVSDAFLAAVEDGYQSVLAVSVVDPDTGDTTDLQVLDGTVTADRTRDVRRTCTLTLTDPDGDLTVTDAEDLLAPFGNELHVARGIALPDGDELVPLGVFRLTKTDVADGPDGLTISLEGSDRALVVQRAQWEQTYVIASGTAVEDAIGALLADRYPAVQVNLPTMGATTPKVVLDGSENDPWRDAVNLAKAAGWELSFDPSGVVVASKPPTPAGTPVLSYVDGEQAVLLDLSRQISTAASVYNGVIATAENTDLDAPLRSVVWDDDSGSPTYYLGKFGMVPLRWSTPLATSQGQLDTAAQTRLDGLLGANEDVEWRQVCNPALDAGDVVEVTRERSGLDAVRVALDVVETPLSPGGSTSAQGRRRFL